MIDSSDLRAASRPLLVLLQLVGLPLFLSKNPYDRQDLVVSVWMNAWLVLHVVAVTVVFTTNGFFSQMYLPPKVTNLLRLTFASEAVLFLSVLLSGWRVRTLLKSALNKHIPKLDKILGPLQVHHRPYFKGCIVLYSSLALFFLTEVVMLVFDFVVWKPQINDCYLLCQFALLYFHFMRFYGVLFESLFLACVMYVWQKYKWIHEILTELHKNVNIEFIISNSKSIKSFNALVSSGSKHGHWAAERTRRLREVNLTLVDLSSQVTHSFGPFLVVVILTSFLGVVTFVYNATALILYLPSATHVTRGRLEFVVYTAVFCLEYSATLLLAATCCHLAASRAASLRLLLRRLQFAIELPVGGEHAVKYGHPIHCELYAEVKRFAKEVADCPLVFSASGIFVLDLHLLGPLAAAVATYFLVLFQSNY